ncbi:NUDIX hydrolase [Bacillus sp. JJ1764]|uniref:NUDIX hydrolase n=1 Tax=Bacillus sp. JJ1764 TaxID=3122964 RepID=UPI002FFE6436
MFFLRETYRVLPDKADSLKEFLNEYLFPSYIKNGAKLIGSWLTSTSDEVIVIWEYPSYQEYENITERIQKDELYQHAQPNLQQFILCSYQDFLTPTGTYSSPKQSVTVSGFITNEKNETLLVKTFWRSDTWELPGGGVDEGETLDKALCREILEETGIQVKLEGVTGVYSNGSNITIVFLGKAIEGSLTLSNETKEVQFIKLHPENLKQFIKRGKYIPRVMDAMKGQCLPYESFKVRPYQLLKRLNGNVDWN